MRQRIVRLGCILLGNLLIAFAVSTLFLDHHIIVGGVSGIGIVLQHFMNLDISMSVGVINVILFLLGLFFMGKSFAMTTLVSTFVFPMFIKMFEGMEFVHGYLNDSLLACVIAGVLVGSGIGLILRSDASTGGVDILALLVNKKFHIPVYIVLNMIDLMILSLQFTFNDTTHVIYGVISVITTSFVLKKTLTTGTSLAQVLVMSQKYQEISDMILHDQDAGVTLLESKGGYTHETSELVLSVIPYRKLPHLKKAIHDIDPLAFVIVSHIDEVGGKGFSFDRSIHI